MDRKFAGHATHVPHGSGIRGLTNQSIDSGEGRFGRLFGLPPAEFPQNALAALAEEMKGDGEVTDGPDPEESDIPAAYTYLGQFIDHDLTFDPSTFAQQKHDATAIRDFRTPRFDLDNLYGRGPADQPYLYDGIKMTLGDKLQIAARNPLARDLPRAGSNSLGIRRAIIGDPRNDENVIVSQLHGLFLRFHNRVADLNPNMPFDAVAQEVRWHYQWLVLHDFLPRIIDPAILAKISPAFSDPTKSFHADGGPHFSLKKVREGLSFMPVEFSVAAYRLGHSMVRPGYRLNEFTAPLPIFDPSNPVGGLNAFGEFPRSWTIDWQRFIDLGLRPGAETKEDRVQRAYRLDTSLVEPLAKLPLSVAGDEAKENPHLFSLAFRNLFRGVELRLPSGQEVASHMGEPPLTDQQILIGAAETGKSEQEDATPIDAIAKGAFATKAPLWVYVLAEARHNFFSPLKRAVLGPVGGRIVAEVFLGLLLADDKSYPRQKHWKPSLGSNGIFGLPDLIREAFKV